MKKLSNELVQSKLTNIKQKDIVKEKKLTKAEKLKLKKEKDKKRA